MSEGATFITIVIIGTAALIAWLIVGLDHYRGEP